MKTKEAERPTWVHTLLDPESHRLLTICAMLQGIPIGELSGGILREWKEKNAKAMIGKTIA